MPRSLRFSVLALAAALLAGTALGQSVTFKDPVGDDNGPGKFVYPTDAVYKPGSFDITELKVTASGGKVDLAVSVNSALEDPWGMKAGFSVQMIFIFIQTDSKDGRFTKTLPGLNVQFAPEDGWNKCVILSPQPFNRVKTEIETKANWAQGAVVIPTRTKGAGRTISASVDQKALGEGDPSKWGYQVVMQSNEGFPAKEDLMTRKVNEFEGQHRFGGGTDTDCDPHAIDIFAGAATGDKSEVDLQHKALAYECNADGTPKKMATIPMIRKK